MHTIAFTGHRPKDLDGVTYITFRNALDALIKGRTDLHFVVGGALGIDTFAAEYARSHGITYSMILPFTPTVQSAYWSDYNRSILVSHMAGASTIRIINDGPYDVRSLFDRNHAMVDQADVVFAVYNGKQGGGTYECIRYALKASKAVYNLFPLNGRLRPIKEV